MLLAVKIYNFAVAAHENYVCYLYCIAGNFTGPNFLENPVSPPEEIFAVLIFSFSASASFGPLPFIIGLTEAERSPVGDGRTSSAGFK